MTPSAVLVGPDPRGQAGFGGIVPTSARARSGGTMVCALALEHHADGAAVPLLVLSEAPGLLGWDPVTAVEATDDRGRTYRVRPLARQSSLGAMQTTVWISPEIPPDARTLRLEVRDLVRTSVGRGGGGVQRPLAGAPWELVIDLVPQRTATPPPAGPPASTPLPAGGPAAVPSRALPAFVGLVPIGQARMVGGDAVCLWALERYADRSVLTVSCLSGDQDVRPLAPGHGRVDAWDDRGRRYLAAPIHGAGGAGWSESSVELVPALDPAARSLAVELADVPSGGGTVVPGPLRFGIALSPPA